jgi:hypothetical protein
MLLGQLFFFDDKIGICHRVFLPMRVITFRILGEMVYHQNLKKTTP